MNSKLSALLWIMLGLSLSCTEKKEVKRPTFDRYREDTALMIKVAEKFINDDNAREVHKAAVATQLTRSMACFDFNDECTQYGELISNIIKATEDGSVSAVEKEALKGELDRLKKTIEEGLHKLSKE